MLLVLSVAVSTGFHILQHPLNLSFFSEMLRFVMLSSALTCFILCSIKSWCIAEVAGPIVHTGTTFADICSKTQNWKALFENYSQATIKPAIRSKNNWFWLWLPISHSVPLKPGAQLQLNPFTRSVQMPLFLQGRLAQSSISVSEDEVEKKKIHDSCCYILRSQE